MKHGGNLYGLTCNACQDARGNIMKELNVKTPLQRLVSRITYYLQPPVFALHQSSANATAAVSREEADDPAGTKASDADDAG